MSDHASPVRGSYLTRGSAAVLAVAAVGILIYLTRMFLGLGR